MGRFVAGILVLARYETALFIRDNVGRKHIPEFGLAFIDNASFTKRTLRVQRRVGDPQFLQSVYRKRQSSVARQ